MENKGLSDLTIHYEENPEGENEDETNITNIDSEEIDQEIITKLRGDAIGDTMYSQSSVIRILLQLADVEWNKKLEEDLCLLWDMTVEKDVCDYLYQLSFPSIATAIILKYNEPRLIEIIIGILGNICSNHETRPDITVVEISIVLNAMETDDHLVLIQIMRFLIAIIYHWNSKLEFISVDIMQNICFILSNSTNIELLLCTMDALSKILSDFEIESKLLNEDILDSLLIAYKFVNKRSSTNENDFDEETKEEKKFSTLFVHIIFNLCSCLDDIANTNLYEKLLKRAEELVEEFRNIIKIISKDDLISLSDDTIFYFEAFPTIFPILNLKYDTDIFVKLFSIAEPDILSKADENKIDGFIEFVRYLISVGDVNNIIKDIENINCDKLNVSKFILEYKNDCEFKYKENLDSIMEKLQEDVK